MKLIYLGEMQVKCQHYRAPLFIITALRVVGRDVQYLFFMVEMTVCHKLHNTNFRQFYGVLCAYL